MTLPYTGTQKTVVSGERFMHCRAGGSYHTLVRPMVTIHNDIF